MFGLFTPRRAVQPGAMLAVDVETTGLRPGADQLISVGWVPVNGRIIDLAGARHFLVAGARVGESATLHGLTDADIEREGVELDEILESFDEALAGRKLLAHFAQMEVGFLGHAYAQCRGEKWRLRDAEVVDTMELERRHMERMSTYPRGEDLRLPRVRQRYGLPRYANHNALTDALACAELYLALTAPK